MPDLIDDGNGVVTLWPDEKCSSCKSSEACELIAVVKKYRLLTYRGMHVCDCGQYVSDESSINYQSVDGYVVLRDAVRDAAKVIDELRKL